MLSLDTAYRSFGGEVEASSTPTICRLSDSRRHQLWAIARFDCVCRRIGQLHDTECFSDWSDARGLKFRFNPARNYFAGSGPIDVVSRRCSALDHRSRLRRKSEGRLNRVTFGPIRNRRQRHSDALTFPFVGCLPLRRGRAVLGWQTVHVSLAVAVALHRSVAMAVAAAGVAKARP